MTCPRWQARTSDGQCTQASKFCTAQAALPICGQETQAEMTVDSLEFSGPESSCEVSTGTWQE